MKPIILIICLFLSGCVAIDYETVQPEPVPLDQKRGLSNIHHLRIGMTYNEVTSIMGEQTKIGYKQGNYPNGSFETITMKSPYRAEVLKDEDKTYEVVYYFTSIKVADGIVADDELTPLVFAKGKLVGKGWDYLFKLRSNL